MKRTFVLGIVTLSLGVVLLSAYQNCAPPKNQDGQFGSLATPDNGLIVHCTPEENCLRFRLSSYSALKCPKGNEVLLETLPTSNGGPTTPVTWSDCDRLSDSRGCCPEGKITASFSRQDNSRSIEITFTNLPYQSTGYGFKPQELTCPCAESTFEMTYGDQIDESEQTVDCSQLCH